MKGHDLVSYILINNLQYFDIKVKVDSDDIFANDGCTEYHLSKVIDVDYSLKNICLDVKEK